MADINDYLDGLNYTLNAEEKQLMDIFAECWEHCHNINCENCEYRSADEYCKMLICISYQYAKRLIDHCVKPVVFCKNCKHYVHSEVCYCRNKKGLTDIVKPDDFCSYGERKEHDNEQN